MEIINHECYVSLEIASLLKEAGFDWKTEFGQHIWDSSKRLETNRNFNSEKYLVSLPTLEVAQRWLREIKGIWVEVLLVNATDPHYRVDLINASRYNNPYGIIHNADYKEYETPEQAQEAGIKKALEIILKQGE